MNTFKIIKKQLFFVYFFIIIISSNASIETLFRRNSFSSACLKRYSSLVGIDYLRETLKHVVVRIMDENQHKNIYELYRKDQVARQSTLR